MKFLWLFLILSLAGSASAATYTCQRADEVPGSDWSYKWSEPMNGKIGKIVFSSFPKTVSIHTFKNGQWKKTSSSYRFNPPEPDTMGIFGELHFGKKMISFPVIPHGTIEGDTTGKKWMIGDLASISTNAYFLCNKSIMKLFK